MSQICAAFFKSLSLFGCEWKLEAFLFSNFITHYFRQFNWLVLTLLLWCWVANSDTGLIRTDRGDIIANLILNSLAVSLVTILIFRTNFLRLFFTLFLVLNLDCGCLCLLLVIVVHIITNFIVHQLFSLSTNRSHNFYAIFFCGD